MRPTTGRAREGFFSHIQNELPGASFLDVFAGSGLMGIEALSRGARSVTFIERDGNVLQALQGNLAALHLTAEIVSGDAMKILPQLHDRGKCFTIAYADPPYGFTRYDELYDLLVSLVPEGEIAIEAVKPHPLSVAGDRILTYGQTIIACFYRPT
ncbi:MAG TPA: 16S rRNA (guanine(966)-N(2))-methyltransferase RsmD [Thermoanaerobaculia bacterium]|nr:16S rRNA (guanine(966)-N(2))-methyltransferase RsmD [Thermoanaerobaculia bacterium]